MTTPPQAKKVLLSGAGGFLGLHALACAPAGLEVLAGLRGGKALAGATQVNIQTLTLDLSRPGELGPTLRTWKPDAVLHLAALADTGACERDPALSHQLNVEASRELARAAAELGIPMVFCSTDLVFDGENAPYRPSDPPQPLMTYGAHKAEAEEAVQGAHPGAVIARLPLMYGLSPRSGRGMIQGMREAWARGQVLHLFSDEYRSLAHAARVAEGLWKALNWPGGIYHFGGPQRLSRLEFGLSLARALGLDSSRIASVRQRDLDTGSARPADVSLDSSSSYALGYAHGSLEEELRSLALG